MSQLFKRCRAKSRTPGKTIFLTRNNFYLWRDITFMSHWSLPYTIIEKQVDAAIDAFLV